MSNYAYNELIDAFVYFFFGATSGLSVSAGIYFYWVACSYEENAGAWWNHNNYSWSPLKNFVTYFQN